MTPEETRDLLLKAVEQCSREGAEGFLANTGLNRGALEDRMTFLVKTAVEQQQQTGSPLGNPTDMELWTAVVQSAMHIGYCLNRVLGEGTGQPPSPQRWVRKL